MIKKIIIFSLILLFAVTVNVNASELLGRISTDPLAVQGGSGEPDTASSSAIQKLNANSGLIIQDRNKKASSTKGIQTKKIEVLGLSHYADGALLRGRDRKIYVINSQAKKYIANLGELRKYRGQTIFDVTSDELAQYELKGHLDGELIREKGAAAVYVITGGKKKHILNLEELRAHYFGLVIYNISREEMNNY